MKETKETTFDIAVICSKQSEIFKVVRDIDNEIFYDLVTNYLADLDDDDDDCINFCDRSFNSYGDNVDGFIISCFEHNNAFVVYWTVKNGNLSDWEWKKCKVRKNEIDCQYILTCEDYVKMISENEIIDEDVVKKYITIIDEKQDEEETSYTLSDLFSNYECLNRQPIIKDCGTFIKISEGYYRKSDINKLNFHWIDSEEGNDNYEDCYALKIYNNNGLEYTEYIEWADDVIYPVKALYELIERIISMINE